MSDIVNYDVYNTSMRRSLIDKAFFLDKVDADVIVDFGCGDGSLIKLIASIFPEYTLIGYDNNPEMIRLAERNVPASVSPFFTNSWDEVMGWVGAMDRSRSAVVCNSLIHEVYAYNVDRSEVIDKFWNRIWKSGFDYVVIRDMFVKSHLREPKIGEWPIYDDPNEPSNPKLVEYVRETSKEAGYPLESFEERWGPIDRIVNLTHFLMKYRYKENWARELDENYFPITQWDFMQVQHEVAAGEYDELVYSEFSALPFNVRRIYEDFGFTFDRPTHWKMVHARRR